MSISALKKQISPIKIAITAIFTALVWIGTVIFAFPYPGTTGYLNFGDSIIFIAALIFGPYTGAISGGIGAMLGDMYYGSLFAPGTLIIKFFEGLIVGFIFKTLKGKASAKGNVSSKVVINTVIAGIVTASSIVIIGSLVYAQFLILWIIISMILIIAIALSIYKLKFPSYYEIISMTAGAAEMVAGYLLYATYVLSQGDFYAYAVPYTPFDIVQGVVCLIIALFVYQALQNTKFLDQVQTRFL